MTTIQRERWDRTAAGWDHCVPVLERWLRQATELMLDQAGVGPGSSVLDVAAGTGGQTLLAARRTGPDGILLATDIGELLVERVRVNAIAEGVTHVYAAVADAEQLDFDPGSFDAAICRLGLMFLPDVAAPLRGIRAALRPGGRFSAIVYAVPEHVDAPLRLPSADCLRVLLPELDEAELSVFGGPGGFCAPCRLLVAGGRRS